MITSGYFIGEIIDELAAVAHQVENRCALGLTDLNIFLENFFKEILNQIMGINLENLNAERCNAPGLDVGDSFSKIAFQITSQRKSDKINRTLKTIIEHKVRDYDEIVVLVIGRKQKSYTLNSQLCAKVRFDEKNIWDINKICKMIIDLQIDDLQSLHSYIKQEVARIKVELEVPDPDWNYPTSILNYIETIPKPLMSDFQIYYSFHKVKQPSEWESTLEDIKTDFSIFCKKLSRLPRVTREFYSFLLERRDEGYDEAWGYRVSFRFNDDKLRRICHYHDMDGDIRLLNEHDFIDVNEPDDYGQSPYLKIFAPGKSGYFLYEFIEFVEETGIGLQRPIVHLDFSSF